MTNFGFNPVTGLSDTNTFPQKPGATAARSQFMVLFNQLRDFINTIVTAINSNSTLFTGTIHAFGGSTAPAGSLLCDGTAVSRSTYSSLFSAISTAWGVGDGSTTFNLPNLKGQTLSGLDASQTEFNTLGKTGGAKTQAYTLGAGYAEVFSGSTAIYENKITTPSWNCNSVNTAAAGTSSQALTGGAQLGGSTDAGNNLQPYAVVNYIIVF